MNYKRKEAREEGGREGQKKGNFQKQKQLKKNTII